MNNNLFRNVAIWVVIGLVLMTVFNQFNNKQTAQNSVEYSQFIEEVKDGKINPFLHMSMHLSVSEQCSIDQPRGIRQAVELLTAKRDSLHDAHHETMDALGQMIWESQRSGRPPDGQAYIDAVQRRATRD